MINGIGQPLDFEKKPCMMSCVLAVMIATCYRGRQSSRSDGEYFRKYLMARMAEAGGFVLNRAVPVIFQINLTHIESGYSNCLIKKLVAVCSGLCH